MGLDCYNKKQERQVSVSIWARKSALEARILLFCGSRTVFWLTKPVLSKAGGSPGMRWHWLPVRIGLEKHWIWVCWTAFFSAVSEQGRPVWGAFRLVWPGIPENSGHVSGHLFKVRNPGKEASLEETVQTALEQIEKKQYDAELLARGIEKERIRHYGFAFEGKKVLIGWWNHE